MIDSRQKKLKSNFFSVMFRTNFLPNLIINRTNLSEMLRELNDFRAEIVEKKSFL